MKKASLCAGVIGAILILTGISQATKLLTHPTNLPLVNVAVAVDGVLQAGLGVFLIVLFLKGRQKEDVAQVSHKIEPNSPEDKGRLEKNRRWVLGFVLLAEILGSVQMWILNSYTAGITPLNLGTIFDILVNIVLLYITIELFRKKRDVLNILFYTIALYALGEIVFRVAQAQWAGIMVSVLMAFYFIYAIKAPLNRWNYRIAHLVILPVFLVSIGVATTIDQRGISALSKQESLLEQQFSDATENLNGAYGLFLQREAPSKVEIQDVVDAKVERDQKIQEVISSIQALQEECKAQLPSVQQQEALERLRQLIGILGVNKKQDDAVGDLMIYSQKLDFSHLTDQQMADMSMLKKKIDSVDSELTRAQFELANSNLDY